MTILITGFEPFGGSTENSSELVIRSLERFRDRGVVLAVLPTSYRRAEIRMRELIASAEPDTIVLLGLNQHAEDLRLERVARNMDDAAVPDNDGVLRIRQRVLAEAPSEYPSALPLEGMVAVARDLGERASISSDAGAFVCNHVFFVTAHLTVTRYASARYGFVHLPAVNGSGDRLNRLTEVVRAWIALLRSPLPTS